MNASIRPKKELLAVCEEAVPNELKVRRQWVAWRLERRGSKLTKVPYYPRSGRRASSVDLTTWSTFEEALGELDAYDGLGFVFSSGDPFVGVDLDGCVDQETGEIDPWAMRIVDELDAYAEFSPSGMGVHVIARGKIPQNVRRGPIEMYSRERFFTVTGHVVGGVQ